MQMRRTVTGVIVLLLVALVMSGCFGIKRPLLDDPPVVTQAFYVAPEARGNGSGSTPENAADFRQSSFWVKVQQSLNDGPTTVYFLPGEYLVTSGKNANGERYRDALPGLILTGYGHPENRLTLQGLYPEGTVFKSLPNEPIASDANWQNTAVQLFQFDGMNATIRWFTFTGDQHMGYATRFVGTDLVIEENTWIDLPRVYYGATGTIAQSKPTRNVTFRNNTFIRVGSGSHAHMIYNAHGVKYLYIINNYFEDSAGDYVRFRDHIDYVVVFGNTFKSTGTWRGGNQPFVSFPLFSDLQPEDRPIEYFGNYAIIARNTFIYPNNSSGGTRQVAQMVHRGYSPPEYSYLLTPQEANVLANGTLEERRTFMREKLGVDPEYIFFYDNIYQGPGAQHSFKFDSRPQYGASSRGWQGTIEIVDVLNSTPIANTAEEAIRFWEEFVPPSSR